MNNEFAKFEKMKDEGVAAEMAYQSAMGDQLGDLFALRMLRTVYGLSLMDAKRLIDGLSKPQVLAVGKKVYWEGSDTIEGTWIVEAIVSSIHDGVVEVEKHRKFLLRPDGLQETNAEGLLSQIPEKYFSKSLADRFVEASAFWQELMQVR
jgi:hypothetical protein